jgi:hypothetical protein
MSARGVCVTANDAISVTQSETLDYATSLSSRDPCDVGAFLIVQLFCSILVRPFPVASSAHVRSLAQRHVRVLFSADGEDGLSCVDTLLRDIMNGGKLRGACPSAPMSRRYVGCGRDHSGSWRRRKRHN